MNFIKSSIVYRVNAIECIISDSSKEYLLVSWRRLFGVDLLHVILGLILKFVLIVLWLTCICWEVDGVIVRKKALEVLSVLGNWKASKRVASVVDVWVLGGLVFEATVSLLAAKNYVALESFLAEEILTIFAGHFEAILLREYIDQLEACANPEAVATVDELVDSSVESTKFWELAVGKPLAQFVKVDSLEAFITNLAQNAEAC